MQHNIIVNKTDSSTEVFVDKHRLVIITALTDEIAVEKFVQACEREVNQLGELAALKAEKVQWNMQQNGRGKNWPVFSQLERLLNRLRKESGIVDS